MEKDRGNKMSTKKLTAIVIVKNEQDKITDCLESLTWCNEVVVVDTGSVDNTVKIAKSYGARVIQSKKKSFDEWRNDGLKCALGEWVLYIDADERVTPDLQKEIDLLVNNKKSVINNAFAIPRKNIIFGKEFKFGGEYPDFQKRLFQKKSLVKWTGKVHEQPEFKGELRHLTNALIHLKHNNLSDMVKKTNDWSEIEAKLMFDANHPPMNIPRFISAIAREFWDRMIRKQGFRDGPEGVVYSLYQVFSRLVSYAKLWEMQEKAK